MDVGKYYTIFRYMCRKMYSTVRCGQRQFSVFLLTQRIARVWPTALTISTNNKILPVAALYKR